MKDVTRTSAGEVLTDLVLDLFRLSNRLTTAGDRLVSGLGLTSARWQILGNMIAAGRAQPVAWLARDMGGSRQNIQRIMNELEKEGLVTFKSNPHHRRAHLVELTEQGRKVFAAAMDLQAPWANDLANGLTVDEIAITRKVIVALHARLASVEGEAEKDRGPSCRADHARARRLSGVTGSDDLPRADPRVRRTVG